MKLKSGNSREISEPKKNGILSKYGKMILGAYLMKKLGTGEHYRPKEHEENKEGLLQKYGKLMLTTYAIKKIQSGKPHEETGQPQQYVKEPSTQYSSMLPHKVKKYGKWLTSAYLMEKLHHKEPEAETTEVVETETCEEDKGSSMVKLSTIVMGAVAGTTAIYAIKKYRARQNGYRVETE